MKPILENWRKYLKEVSRASAAKARAQVDELFELQRDARWEIIPKIPGWHMSSTWTTRGVAALGEFLFRHGVDLGLEGSEEKLKQVVQWMGVRAATRIMKVPIQFLFPKSLKRMPIMYRDKKRWGSQRLYFKMVKDFRGIRPEAGRRAAAQAIYPVSLRRRRIAWGWEPALQRRYGGTGYILMDATRPMREIRGTVRHELMHHVDNATTVRDLKNFLKKIRLAPVSVINRAFAKYDSDDSTKWIINWHILKKLMPKSVSDWGAPWDERTWEQFAELGELNLELQKRYNTSVLTTRHMLAYCTGADYEALAANLFDASQKGEAFLHPRFSHLKTPFCKGLEVVLTNSATSTAAMAALHAKYRVKACLRWATPPKGGWPKGYQPPKCTTEDLKALKKEEKRLHKAWKDKIKPELIKMAALMNRLAKVDLGRPTQRPKV